MKGNITNLENFENFEGTTPFDTAVPSEETEKTAVTTSDESAETCDTASQADDQSTETVEQEKEIEDLSVTLESSDKETKPVFSFKGIELSEIPVIDYDSLPIPRELRVIDPPDNEYSVPEEKLCEVACDLLKVQTYTSNIPDSKFPVIAVFHLLFNEAGENADLARRILRTDKDFGEAIKYLNKRFPLVKKTSGRYDQWDLYIVIEDYYMKSKEEVDKLLNSKLPKPTTPKKDAKPAKEKKESKPKKETKPKKEAKPKKETKPKDSKKSKKVMPMEDAFAFDLLS